MFRQSSKSVRLDFNTGPLLAGVLEAARMAIDDVSSKGADIARTSHPWHNDTFQTEYAVYEHHARVDLEYGTVWGEWGVTDRPRVDSEDNSRLFSPSEKYREQFRKTYGSDHLARAKILSTKDVALFLEFGTVLKSARPWLYPAWDATKGLLPERLKIRYEQVSHSGTPFAIRVPKGMPGAGQFSSQAGLNTFLANFFRQ